MVVLSSSNTRSKSYMTQKWVLHLVVAPIRDQKNVSKCPQNYYFGDVKMNFFLGRGHSPLPRPLSRTPPPRRLAPPSEILNTPLYPTADSNRRRVGA